MRTPNTQINWLFIVLWLTVATFHLMGFISAWWVIPLFLIWLGIKVAGSVFIGLNFYFHSLCSTKTNDRVVALTFDDGPDKDYTLYLLDLLDEHHVKATFFVIGEKAEAFPNEIKEIQRRGHLLGNHSYTHARFFDLYSFTRMRLELMRTQTLLLQLTGLKTKFFRPPYGVTNPILGRVVRHLKLVSIGWSVRSLDTTLSTDKTLTRLKRKTHPGAVVLLHDTTPDIVNITRNYINWLFANNYRVIPLDQLLSIKAYE